MKHFLLLLFTFQALSNFCQSSLHAIDTTMVFVNGGSFSMGSNNGKADERPVHIVTLNDFYIGKYEVTQQVWRAVMGSDTLSSSDCPTCPVYDVKPNHIDVFILKLNLLTGKHYRLPTEAEWEYAAIGGKASKGFKYCGSNRLDSIAWYAPNSGMVTHPVGLKQPNELGLYDMSGNVWEMCVDWYQRNFYKICSSNNPCQTKKRMFRLVRGGSWRSEEQRCQSRARNIDVRDHHISNSGFRLVMEIK
ncbi:MAG: formylglycine-generating enzyme family protein [Chitinophagales bacterium]|nr:formylglycine-generating enzyme family protein [Chitinophagales bacterium]